MINTLTNEIKIVIGSWGSYNACNERALGSKWLTLSDYDDWEDIEEALQQQGFLLDGIDEELFIQDIENLDLTGVNTDYMHPKHLFEILQESEVLTDSGKYDTLITYLEVRTFNEFESRVEQYGSSWDDDIYIYAGYSWETYGREILANSGQELPDGLEDYFDFEEYGKSYQYSGSIEEYSSGLIEIN